MDSREKVIEAIRESLSKLADEDQLRVLAFVHELKSERNHAHASTHQD